MLTEPIYHNREVSEIDLTPEESKISLALCLFLLAFILADALVIWIIWVAAKLYFKF